MKTSGRVALGGVFGALSLLCLLGTVFPSATFALTGVAGLFLLPVLLEAGAPTGWLTFGAVAALDLLLTPALEAKVLFVAFLGYYPLFKLVIEPLPRPISWVIKFALFNATVVASYWLMLQVFGLESDTFELFGVNLPLVFWAVANVTFLLYDICLSLLIQLYMQRVHPRMKRLFH